MGEPQKLEMMKAFDPNDEGMAKLPSNETHAITLEHYVNSFEAQIKKTNSVSSIEQALDMVAKSLQAPPNAYSFANMQLMPDQNQSGIIPWPGIAPNAIGRVYEENVLPKMVINMRIDDVVRYSLYSAHPWRPGWKLETMEGDKTPTAQDRRDMLEARKFLENANLETSYAQTSKRDNADLSDFQRFLSAMVRDSLTYDGIAIWKQTLNNGKVNQFKLLPASHIRLVDKRIGYLGDTSVFAVLLDQGGNVALGPENKPHAFSRDEMVWYVRNPSTNPLFAGYGSSEIEQSLRLISGFQNALDLNVSTFDKSSIPNGLLILKGQGWAQKQLDIFQRMWRNLKMGISKTWALPVLNAPSDGDIELLNFNDLKGSDVRYQDLMNMVAGGLCAIFRFPPNRLGYRISGKGPDNTPPADSQVNLNDEDDPGLMPLLIHIENVINQYLLWNNWPNLRFSFCGKSPREDGREYQMRVDAMTWGEARAEADLPDIASLLKKRTSQFDTDESGDKGKKADLQKRELFELLSMIPLNPNLQGAFQSVVAAYVKSKQDTELMGDESQTEQHGNMITQGSDPANKPAHGHTAGVRRNSASEKKK